VRVYLGENVPSKKLFLSSAVLCVLVSFLFVGCVGASSEVWSQTYGGTADDSAEAVVQTSDGGYALAGYTRSFGAGSYDFWLVKTNEYGDVEWNQTYGGEDIDYAYALVEASDGGYAIAGYTESFGAGSYDFWLVKTDNYGNMEWNQTYGGTGGDRAFALIETSDGGYALAGGALLVKTDAYGNVEWNQTYSGWSAYALVETSDGGFAFAGYTKTIGVDDMPHWDFWLVKTDANGNTEWERTYGSTTDERAHALVETSDGGYALAGYTSIFSPATGITSEYLLVKTDEHGNMEWNNTYAKSNAARAYAVVEASDGGYALAGIGPLIKTDKYGNMLWNQTVEGVVNSLVTTSDGGYALAGGLNFDFWLAKVADENGVTSEFPSWIPLLITLVVVVVVAVVGITFVYRRKLKKQRRSNAV
jgi:hypothetical protein